MNSKKKYALGIDLGTTNSCIAFMDETGKPCVIKNSQGGRTTPSIVHIDKHGKITVGELARRRRKIEPNNTIISIKRWMGRTEYSLPENQIVINDRKYTPEEISSHILRYLKQNAEKFLGEDAEFGSVVITVPAYFAEPQRQATYLAAKMAGFEESKIDLLSEPTAAAVHYGLNKNGKFLVYDLGGGTFDISILDLNEGVFEVKATNGNMMLGGDDFDKVIVDFLIKQLNNNIQIDAYAMQQLYEAAENAKKALSEQGVESTQIDIHFAKQDYVFNYNLTIGEFNILTKELVTKTIQPIKDALSDAKLTPKEIDEVILVGGSTRNRSIPEMLKREFNFNVKANIDPDECVALGAAIKSSLKIDTSFKNDIILIDTLPLSLGMELANNQTAILLPKNTRIPNSVSQMFTTSSNMQPEIVANILQGESPLANKNTILGTLVLKGIQRAPAGVPQILITFTVDSKGLIHITAEDQNTKSKSDVKLTRPNLSTEQIEKVLHEAEQAAENDKRVVRIIQQKSFLQSTVLELSNLDQSKMSEEDKKCITDLNNKIVDKFQSLDVLINSSSVTEEQVVSIEKDCTQLLQSISTEIQRLMELYKDDKNNTEGKTGTNENIETSDEIKDETTQVVDQTIDGENENIEKEDSSNEQQDETK